MHEFLTGEPCSLGSRNNNTTGVCLRIHKDMRAGSIIVARAATVAFALGIAASAQASDDSEEIEITGRIPPQCSFTETPANTKLGTLNTNAEYELGNLGFTCNLAELSTVNLTVRSANGALKRDGGTETVAYSAWWKVGAFRGFETVAAWNPAAKAFTEPSAANGVQKSAVLAVKVTGPTANLTAGDYTDTLTFTVSP